MFGLNEFNEFGWRRFADGKTFVCTGQRPWTDRDSGSVLGTIVDAVIYRDDTVYTKRKDGDTRTNRFEKIAFKVSKAVNVPVDAQIKPVNAVATIWGDYRNNLSVKAEDIEIVQTRQAPAKAA